jgi:hypothetical protein
MGLAMWKIVASPAIALLAVVGIGSAAAQTPPPLEPAAKQREATLPPAANPRKHKTRHVSRHHRRRLAGSFKCFGHEWRPFPARDPNGYFYTPRGGGIC